jgi:hypothetical protein
VKIESKPGGVDEGIADEAVAGRLDVLLRAELAADSSLNGLEINTITQVNPRTLPALRLGKNRIVAVSDEHLEYLVLHPRLTGDQHVREVYRASGWQSLSKPGWTEPSIRAADKGELVLLAQAPRPIRKIRMACTAQLVEPAGALAMDVSYDDGKTWRELGKFPFRGAPYDIRPSAATVSVPANVHKALLRYAVTGSGNGLVNVVAEAGFEPAKPGNPCDITYRWEEYRDGAWLKRTHTERISEGYQSYVINVGGSRPPRMNSLEVGPAGTGKPGYSDGVKDPPVTARPDVMLVYGRPISVGSKYTVSREAGAAFPDVGSGLLTDGYVGLAGYWALDNINLSGRKNEKRVGELVVWEPGEELVVTVDLGQSRKVGGARVCAVQPNARVLYPARMIVEVSPDGNNFASAGEVGWEECFFPSADFLPWEGVDSPLYDHLPAGGMTDFKFPVVFQAPAEARYVRFRLKPPADANAGMGLWEVEVYDGIKREPWSNRIVLPRPPSAPST